MTQKEREELYVNPVRIYFTSTANHKVGNYSGGVEKIHNGKDD